MKARARIKLNLISDNAAKAGIKPFPFQIKEALWLFDQMTELNKPVKESVEQIKEMNQVKNRGFCNRCRTIIYNLKQRR